MTKLEKIKKRLLALKPGESGVLIKDGELMEIEVPEAVGPDTQSRAEWLQKQLPFSCCAKSSATTGDWVFSRRSN